MAYTLKTKIANKSNYGNRRSLSDIEYIVIHYTSNDGDTDENNGKYYANTVVKASAHYFIDDDSITQSVPDDYVAWSVGGKKYNNCSTTGGGKLHGIATNANTLSIEICDDVKNGVIYPSQSTIENVIAFTKIKMKEYNIPASNIIRHFDVTGKSCPAYWIDDAKWKSEFWNKLTTTDSVPTNTTTPSTTTSTTRNYLMKGDEGAEVKKMQENLIYMGYSCGKAGADGDFGNGTDSAVRAFQKANKLTVDGKYGVASKTKLETLVTNKKKASATTASTSTYTKSQFIKDVQKAIGVTVDGIVGNKTLGALVTVSKSKNNRHAVVKPLQKYLNTLGYNCGTPDGVAGSKFDSAAKSWAKANGCVSDGEFTKGGKSWKRILGVL